MLRGILFIRGGLNASGLYRSAAGRVRIRNPEKNTLTSKFWMYCVYIQNFERGANTLRTARGYTPISDGRLCVNKTLLLHIFITSAHFQRHSRLRIETRKSVTSRAGREISSWDLDDAGSLRTSGGSVAHFSAQPRDEDQTDSPTGLISLVCKS